MESLNLCHISKREVKINERYFFWSQDRYFRAIWRWRRLRSLSVYVLNESRKFQFTSLGHATDQIQNGGNAEKLKIQFNKLLHNKETQLGTGNNLSSS